MASFSTRIAQAWYRRAGWLWLLFPISVLFRLLIALRRWAYRFALFKSWRAPVPVIVVGNISVGGTGKTPLVEALVRRLTDAGWHPGIASRGYGGNPPITPYSVTPDSAADICGDEPLLLARRTGVPVVIDSDRCSACRCLVEQHHCDVIVSDDGLQHYRMQRDIEIVVVDGERGLGNGKVLPMGPLREPASRLREVDFVVVNGEAVNTQLSDQTVHAMSLQPITLVNIETRAAVSSDHWSSAKRVHAVAGIGNPGRFFAALEQLGFDVIKHPFEDHHRFTAEDIAFGDDLPVLMTEKDAVKCQSLQPGERYWFLTIEAVLDRAFFDALFARLQLIRKPHQQECQQQERQ